MAVYDDRPLNSTRAKRVSCPRLPFWGPSLIVYCESLVQHAASIHHRWQAQMARPNGCPGNLRNGKCHAAWHVWVGGLSIGPPMSPRGVVSVYRRGKKHSLIFDSNITNIDPFSPKSRLHISSVNVSASWTFIWLYCIAFLINTESGRTKMACPGLINE